MTHSGTHSSSAPLCPWAEAASRIPDGAAFVQSDGRTVSWRAFDLMAEHVRKRLDEAVDGPIALVVTNQPEDALLLVAALRSGRDIALFGHRAPREAIRDEASRLEMSVLEASLASGPFDESEIGCNPVRLTGATLIRTSGSTGQARWIRHTAQAHIASARAANARLGLNENDRWAWCLPSHHVGGLSILWRCALAGAAAICLPDASIATWYSGEQQGQLATHLSLVPTQLRDLVDADISPSKALKSVIVGGAALSSDLLTRAVGAGWPVRTTYGMTETASMVALSEVWREPPAGPVHAGHALDHAELEARDGRVFVRTRAMGQGLANRDGWLATSDRARVVSGRWIIEGRLDRVIISGGENLDPARIESAIRSLPGIEECIVVAVPDVRYGHRPVAFVSTSDAKASAAVMSELRKSLTTKLASFEIPDAFLHLPPLEDSQTKWSSQQLEQLAQSSKK